MQNPRHKDSTQLPLSVGQADIDTSLLGFFSFAIFLQDVTLPDKITSSTALTYLSSTFLPVTNSCVPNGQGSALG